MRTTNANNQICEFDHPTLNSVQIELKNILDLYELGMIPDFTTNAARFIAEGMDYICNVQIPKKSCDAIYQYQYIMRSELFVSERQQILDELKPLITLLKEEKFGMLPQYDMLKESQED